MCHRGMQQQMNPKSIVFSEINQTQKSINSMFHFYDILERQKYDRNRKQLQDWGWRKRIKCTGNLWRDGNILYVDYDAGCMIE